MSKFFDDEYAARALYLLVKPTHPMLDVGFNNFQRVMIAVKDLIEKLPGGPLKLRQLAVAYRFILDKRPLLKEDVESVDPKALIIEYLKMLEFVVENGLRLVEEEYEVRNAIDVLAEDGEGGGDGGGAPTNSTAGVEPHDQPVIEPATKKNKRKMDTRAAYAELFSRN